MKLTATLGEETSEINIKSEDGTIFAEVDGRKYELEISEPESNIYLFKYNNKIFEVFVSPSETFENPMEVSVGSHAYEISVSDPKRLRGTSDQADTMDGSTEIKTAMPGKIVSLLKGLGMEVEKGEGVIVVEAMKMQNEMKSPKDGIIKEIFYKEGDIVNAGDV